MTGAWVFFVLRIVSRAGFRRCGRRGEVQHRVGDTSQPRQAATVVEVSVQRHRAERAHGGHRLGAAHEG